MGFEALVVIQLNGMPIKARFQCGDFLGEDFQVVGFGVI
jgi:hypothetical protein